MTTHQDSWQNARNKSLLFVDAFFPSQQNYVFTWYFEDAIPTLLDQIALLKTATMITNQCPRMCPAMAMAIERLGKYGKTLRRLYKWHKVSIYLCPLTDVIWHISPDDIKMKLSTFLRATLVLVFLHRNYKWNMVNRE